MEFGVCCTWMFIQLPFFFMIFLYYLFLLIALIPIVLFLATQQDTIKA
jgi:hypothetical protein